MQANRSPREPVWSDRLTTVLAERIPARRRTVALVLIKAFHSFAFFAISACIVLLVWDGIRGRHGRRALLAGGITVAEVAIYGSNNQVCPLTPLAEQLGAERGSVTDIYLPRWLSARVPLLGGSAVLVGIALQVIALKRPSHP